MRNLKPVVQPFNSSMCGQCCVAMIANVPLEVATQVIGHKEATTAEEILKALRALGVKCSDIKHKGFRTDKVKCAIVGLKGKKIGHWVVWRLGWFDPALGLSSHSSNYGADKAAKIIMYLEVYQ